MTLPLPPLRESLWLAGIASGVIVLWLLAKGRMEYHIGKNAFRVRLGRLTLRRIPFSEIVRVSKPRRNHSWFTTENWRSVFRDSHRLLMIERRSGVFRRLMITPRHRYEFQERLRIAIQESLGTESLVNADDQGKEGEVSDRA
jgi:hypothetical protein